jgi:uncharacterized protein (TIGR03086 family)
VTVVPDPLDERAATHLRCCARLSEAVTAVDDRWGEPTPCGEWDTRDVLEHVIGFHDALLLRPLEAKPHRPEDDPEERWAVTVDALEVLYERPGLFEMPIEVPAREDTPPTTIEAARLVPVLSQDVFVHAWDLARAVNADDRLDPELCAEFLARLPTDVDALAATGMFSPPVAVPEGSDPQTRLLARLGRDPHWSPSDLR